MHHVTRRRRQCQCQFNLKALMAAERQPVSRDAHAALGPSASLDEDQLAALAIHSPDKLNPPDDMVLLGAGPTSLVLAQRRRHRSVGGVLKFHEIVDMAHHLKDIRGAAHSAHECSGRTFQARILDAQNLCARHCLGRGAAAARRQMYSRSPGAHEYPGRLANCAATRRCSRYRTSPSRSDIAPGCTFLKCGSLLQFERWSFPKKCDIFMFSDSLI
ncbi:hypothetical protein FA95DRAFT_1136712 [Auriscalpium vulgare]|uniref:Uncharacterized protein n=1 Tax=Auriscalpium vulgare TaxID=40419 RepID=A0ACB8R514_9AGAM|nr:hypothetical protein FA95DRAFT_1136712 [Auriscalpium vulgare]